MAYSLLIVDSHKIILEGMGMLLGGHPEIRSLNSVQSYTACIDWLELQEALPDVVLLEINLPDQNGLGALQEMIEEYPDIRIILFTGSEDLPMIREAFRLGARGYLKKNVGKDDLLQAIRAVSGNNRFIDTDLHEKIIDLLVNNHIAVTPNHTHEGQKASFGLTRRELEIIPLIAEGKTNNDIARLLFLSPSTVDTHRKNIMSKCEVHNVAELTAFAFKHGLALHKAN